jgi:hypothetical protein
MSPAKVDSEDSVTEHILEILYEQENFVRSWLSFVRNVCPMRIKATAAYRKRPCPSNL